MNLKLLLTLCIAALVIAWLTIGQRAMGAEGTSVDIECTGDGWCRISEADVARLIVALDALGKRCRGERI